MTAKANLKEMMAQDSVRTPSSKELSDLGKIINSYNQLEVEAAQLSEQLVAKQAQMNKLSTETIPNMFLALGLTEIKMSDGSKVQIKPFYSGSINDENRVPALEWLRTNNLGDVIKHELKVQLGKGEDTKAEKLKAQLIKLKMNYIDVEGVHPQTLKALIKEQIEKMGEGKENEEGMFPMKLFNAFIGKTTKIIKPK